MADSASLVVRVSSRGVSETSRTLDSFAGMATKAASAVAGLVSVSATMQKLVSVARQTDVLKAGLVTMTGSMENANAAFAELSKFAANTPYALDQSVTAFTKLVSMGLTPSQKALESYGNTAAAMGKDLNQMIEAVADAATFEFERLKEFGIRASQQGDEVAFTFQGVTTTVKKNAAEIEGYLMALGENQFAGAMANRMVTLDGALSNLQDSWDGLFRAVSTAGTGEAIAEQVRYASAALDDLTASISSGEAMTLITAWGGQWEATLADVRQILAQTDEYVTEIMNGWGVTAKDTSSFMSDAFWEFPANIRALIQIATTEIAGFVDKAKAYGVAAAEALNPLSQSNWSANLQLELGEIEHRVASLNAEYLAQRDTAVGALDAQKEKAKELRAEFDKVKPPLDLGQFKAGGGGGAQTSEADQKKAQKAKDDLERQKKQAADFVEIQRQSNLDEMGLIDAKEAEKLATLKAYQQQGLISTSQYEAALTDIQLNAETARQEELARLRNRQDQMRFEHDMIIAEVNSLNAAEIELITQQEEQKKAVMQRYRDEGIINEQEYQNALVQIAKQAEEDKFKTSVAIMGDTVDNMRTALGEGNKVYKAFAIANAIMDTYAAATAAYKSTAAIPVVGPFLAPVAAGAAIGAGMAQVSKIRSAREQGGNLAAGQMSTIAERGQPEVIMPASASRVRTAQQMRQIMGESGASSQPTNVQIVNQTTGRIDSATTERMDEATLRVIIRETVSSDLTDSNSSISKSRRTSRGQAGF